MPNVRLANTAGRGETNPKIIGTILQQIQSGKAVVELGNLTPKRNFVYLYDIVWVVESPVRDPACRGRPG